MIKIFFKRINKKITEKNKRRAEEGRGRRKKGKDCSTQRRSHAAEPMQSNDDFQKLWQSRNLLCKQKTKQLKSALKSTIKPKAAMEATTRKKQQKQIKKKQKRKTKTTYLKGTSKLFISFMHRCFYYKLH